MNNVNPYRDASLEKLIQDAKAIANHPEQFDHLKTEIGQFVIDLLKNSSPDKCTEAFETAKAQVLKAVDPDLQARLSAIFDSAIQEKGYPHTPPALPSLIDEYKQAFNQKTNEKGREEFFIKLRQQPKETRFEFLKSALELFFDSSMREDPLRFLSHFDLDQDQRFQIAKLCAQTSAYRTVRLIQNFDLTVDQRFEVAKLCVQNGGVNDLFSPIDQKDNKRRVIYIQNFDLTVDQRFEVTKLSAPEYGRRVFDWMRYLDLNEEQQFKVAQLCMRHDHNALELLNRLDLPLEKVVYLLQIAVFFHPRGVFIKPSLGFFNTDLRNCQQLLKKDNEFELILAERMETSAEEALLSLADGIEKHMPGVNARAVVNELRQIEHPADQKNVMQLVVVAILLWKRILSPQAFSWLSHQGIFEQIVALRATHLRPELLLSLTRIAQKEDPQIFASISLEIEKTYPWGLLLQLSLFNLQTEGVSITELQSFLNEKRVLQVLYNLPSFLILLEALGCLATEENLSLAQKQLILKELCQDPRQLIERAQALSLILELGKSEYLNDLSPGLPAIAETCFKEILPMDKIENFPTRYKKEFGGDRIHSLLLAYAGHLHRLDQKGLMNCLGDHVAAVLNGTYTQERYDIATNTHLRQIHDSFPNILVKWQENWGPQPLASLLSDQLAQEPVELPIFEWLCQELITDQHLDLKSFPFLREFLNKNSLAKLQLIEAVKALKGNKDLLFQTKVIQLAEAKPEDRYRLMQELSRISHPTFNNSEFKKNVQAWLDKQDTQLQKDLFAYETDDPQDLFLCGTEIKGSCQHVRGNPNLNQGLLGYLRNGQTRLLAIKDKTGRLVARSLLRLLWDGEKPVLFLERFYSNNNDPRLAAGVEALAKRAAKRLGCPLTTKGDGAPYDNPLRSLGGLSPVEYVDGVSGIARGSTFIIHDATLIP